MRLIQTVLLFASLVNLGGCVSFPSNKALVQSINSRELVIELTLPTGERFFSPHGLYWSEYIRKYYLTIKNAEGKYSTKDFQIYYYDNSKDIPVKTFLVATSGYVKLNFDNQGCEIEISIQPEAEKHNILNTVHEVVGCSKT